jgi:hypothetical protein
MRAHREQELRAREAHRRRDDTAHAIPMPASNDGALRALAWTAIALLLVAAVLVAVIG